MFKIYTYIDVQIFFQILHQIHARMFIVVMDSVVMVFVTVKQVIQAINVILAVSVFSWDNE